MQPDSFVHLHVHSKYSLDDGVASVEQLVEGAARLGMTSLALTDHNSLAGVVSFRRACEDKHIHPVYGAELDVLPASADKFSPKTFRYVVLAENDSGYGNLVSLASLARRRETDGTPPHLSLNELAARRAGLIFLIGTKRSELYSLLARKDVDALSEHIEILATRLGPDRLVFSISDFGDPEAGRINAHIAELADFLQAPLVAVNDVHYLLPEDELAHRFLRGVPQGVIYPHRFLRETKTRHLASADEMLGRLPGFEKALQNTTPIAQRCNVALMAERRRFPVHDFERGFDAESDLWDRVFQRATRLYGELNERRKTRLNVELDYIRRNGLADYFQLLFRISQHLSDRNITRGTGQGQLLTSLVAYVLGLTEIDPIEYNLNFFGEHGGENATPVFSIALPNRSFDQVFRYLRETYGENRVARVGRFSPSHRGTLFKQMCEWSQMPRARMRQLFSQNLLDSHGHQPARLVELLDPKGSSISPGNPKFLRFLISRLHPRLRPLTPIEGRLIISGEDLDRVTPRERHEGGEVAQIPADDLKYFDLPQIHLVANPLLNALDDALRWIRDEHGVEVNLSQIALDDKATFDLLREGLTNGIPPFQSATLKTLLRKHRPTTLPKLVKVKLELTPDEENAPADAFTNAFMDCLLGYRCAYLKTRYPVSFMTAMLNNTLRDRKAFAVLWRETARMGIRVIPLNINHSEYEFTQEGDAIRVGMRVVQQQGEKAYEEIDRVRRGGEFTDLMDLCRRTDPKFVTRQVILNLILTGALDCFGHTRASLCAALPAILAAARPHTAREDDSPTLFDALGIRIDSPVAEPEVPDIAEFSTQRLLDEEKRVALFVLSQKPLAPYRDYLERCRALLPGQLTSRHEGAHVFLAGYIDHRDREGPALEGAAVWLLDFEGLTVEARHVEAETYSAAIFSDDAVLLGGKIKTRGDSPMVTMSYCATLRDLRRQTRETKKIILDLRNEDKRTLKLIHAVLKRYPGDTLTETRGYEGPGAGRWLARIESNKIFWCPSLAHDLRQILPDTCISVETLADE